MLQCFLDAFSAVMVGALGRALGGRRGTWAGLAYAAYWPAVELPSRTLTENLHTPLLLAGFATLARSSAEDDSSRRTMARAAAGGFLVGLSALARAVSAAFLPLAALWRWRVRRGRAGAVQAAAILAAGAAASNASTTISAETAEHAEKKDTLCDLCGEIPIGNSICNLQFAICNSMIRYPPSSRDSCDCRDRARA